MSCSDVAPATGTEKTIDCAMLNALSDRELQLHLEGAVRAYCSRIEEGAEIQPFTHARAVSATEVMIVVSRMLKSTGIEVFELGMWQAWTGGR
jgi:hypothetical protein